MLTATGRAFRLAKRERRSGNLPEVLVWRELRKRPGDYKFRRQHPIGELVLDFVCLEKRLVIEIDGRSHDFGDRPDRDVRREAVLRVRGFEVLRLAAQDVLGDLEGAISAIVFACDGREPIHHWTASGGPPPRAGEVP